jgi:hypothetical protein
MTFEAFLKNYLNPRQFRTTVASVKKMKYSLSEWIGSGMKISKIEINV